MVTRRQWLGAGAAAAFTGCAGQRPGPVSARDATIHYLERIGEIDRLIHAVIEVNPEALAIAAGLDEERRAGRRRGLLHGMPVLIKDNIDTADRMMTTAGSLALVGAPRPKQDAAVVARLRAAGAVILGKTNLSEWGQHPVAAIHQRLERARRANQQPACAGPESVGLEQRLRRGGGGRPVRGGGGNGDGWLDRIAVVEQWHRGHQAHRGIVERPRNHSDFA